MSNLRRTARRHQGVTTEIWHNFVPGQKVITPEGYWGTITAVEDGPWAGYEQYVVTLDGGAGGGNYDDSELMTRCDDCGDLYNSEMTLAMPGHTHRSQIVDDYVAAATASDAISHTGAKTAAIPLVCSGCGQTYFTDGEAHGCEGPEGSLHDHWTEAAKTADMAGIIGGEGDDTNAPNLHPASDDYPELADILGERLPLPHSTRVSSLQPQIRAEAMPMIDPLPEWAIKSQFEQYPSSGPDGVSYFKGEIDADTWVDCLLYRKDGHLVGVLNHFPKDMGPEKAGNVLLMVLPEYRQQGIGRALWDEAVRRWHVSGAQQDTSPDGAAFLKRMSVLETLQREAGFWDRALEPLADVVLKSQENHGTSVYNAETGAMYSFDWCRFRHNRRCFYPRQLDQAATKIEGRAVWVPEDRGFCPREKWPDQKACPAPSEPGPKSGDPNWKYETWKSWEDGGQGRYASLGMPGFPPRTAVDAAESVEDLTRKPKHADPEAEADRDALAEMVNTYRKDKNPYVQSARVLREGEFGFHLTATWREVQAKAKEIRSEGHVRVISASVEYLVGEVQGSHNVYQTSLMRVPGTKKVAAWECGCAWAAYSWGRSGRWKKYEGRMCSHALALNYEAQSRGWAGGEISEDRKVPDWRRDQKVVVPGDYSRPPIGEWRKGSLSRVSALCPGEVPQVTAVRYQASHPGSFTSIDEAVLWMLAQAEKVEPMVTATMRWAAEQHHGEMQGLENRFKSASSVTRKLLTKGIGPSGLVAPFSKISDVLRYTIALPEPDWANNVQQILWDVENRGFKIVTEENSWQRGDSYSGLHYNMQVPGSDLVLELQFHTTTSYSLKTDVLHDMYEEFRDKSVPLPRRQQLFDEMTRYWDKVPIPTNALEFPDEKHFLRPVASVTGSTVRPVSTDPDLATRPVYALVRDLLDDGTDPGEVIAALAALGVADAPGIFVEAKAVTPFKALVNGIITKVLDLLDNGKVKTEVGEVSPQQVVYPTYSPSRGLTASRTTPRTAKADTDGYMVAIEIPEDLKTALHALCESRYGEDAESADNYHLTVVYPGDAADVDGHAFEEATRTWAARWGAMTGSISGFGVFHQDNGDKVLYASVNVPGLDRARDDLVDILATHGIALPDDYGYTPHLTLGYFTGDAPEPPEAAEDVLGVEFGVDAVTLAMGGEWRSVPLAQATPLAAAATLVEADLLADSLEDTTWSGTPSDGLRYTYVTENKMGHTVVQARERGWPVGQITFDGDGRVLDFQVSDSVAEDAEEIRAGLLQRAQSRHPNLAVASVTADLQAELQDEPEPALPFTTAEPETPADEGDDLVAGATDLDDRPFVPGDPRLAYLLEGTGPRTGARGGEDDMKIAEAARAYLAGDPEMRKAALKNFSPAEQQQIIEEGAESGVTAANLADLDIAGTHYEALEAAFAAAEAEGEDDESWLY